MTKKPGKERAFPFFKVQSRDPVSLTWKDHRKEAFNTELEARDYRKALSPDLLTRIVRWERSGSKPVQD